MIATAAARQVPVLVRAVAVAIVMEATDVGIRLIVLCSVFVTLILKPHRCSKLYCSAALSRCC